MTRTGSRFLAALGLASAMALGGCAYDDGYGYGGVSVGTGYYGGGGYYGDAITGLMAMRRAAMAAGTMTFIIRDAAIMSMTAPVRGIAGMTASAATGKRAARTGRAMVGPVTAGPVMGAPVTDVRGMVGRAGIVRVAGAPRAIGRATDALAVAPAGMAAMVGPMTAIGAVRVRRAAMTRPAAGVPVPAAATSAMCRNPASARPRRAARRATWAAAPARHRACGVVVK